MQLWTSKCWVLFIALYMTTFHHLKICSTISPCTTKVAQMLALEKMASKKMGESATNYVTFPSSLTFGSIICKSPSPDQICVKKELSMSDPQCVRLIQEDAWSMNFILNMTTRISPTVKIVFSTEDGCTQDNPVKSPKLTADQIISIVGNDVSRSLMN